MSWKSSKFSAQTEHRPTGSGTKTATRESFRPDQIPSSDTKHQVDKAGADTGGPARNGCGARPAAEQQLTTAEAEHAALLQAALDAVNKTLNPDAENGEQDPAKRPMLPSPASRPGTYVPLEPLALPSPAPLRPGSR